MPCHPVIFMPHQHINIVVATDALVLPPTIHLQLAAANTITCTICTTNSLVHPATYNLHNPPPPRYCQATFIASVHLLHWSCRIKHGRLLLVRCDNGSGIRTVPRNLVQLVMQAVVLDSGPSSGTSYGKLLLLVLQP